MINKLKKISLRDILGVIKFIIVLFPSLIYKIFLKITNKELWLICETNCTARDNGYIFYKYMKEKHPEMKTYYAIGYNCKDYDKVKKYGNIIKWASLKHYFIYMSATKNISSHKEGNPNQTLFTIMHLYLHLYNNRVFLQHGITKDDAEMFYYKNTKFKYFICGAKREYEFIKEKFGYPSNNVVYTGFARFDNLYENELKKQILVIPTWRRWFELENDSNKFIESEYFKMWNNFLNNEELNKFIKEKKIELVFYPHSQMKKFISKFNIKNKDIKIINNEVDIQKLLKESSLMITDYSSVYMDFAYMKKPIIYYQFDYKKYRESHFKEGYFDYKKDGFGLVTDSEDDLVKELKIICNNDFQPSNTYKKRMNDFFKLSDSKNCERIYQLLKRGE